ncbi:MAG: acetate kinase [Methylobacter sp.]|uniref:acetate/propionate family kinase n=1 Tax=Methylobacter sp. TaxID=2051955 RepID=UPI00272F0F8A|nr:acetate kinase [Methylobacter sp.]MDP1663513.1 acetate kinase [Methylobacter sp.]
MIKGGAPKVLVINCGSSSIKYGLFAMEPGHLLAGGLLERIGESGSLIRHRTENAQGELVENQNEIEAPDHRAAFAHIADVLRGTVGFEAGQGPDAIGHRVVHGGEAFSVSVAINQAVIDTIRNLIPLAPLHNPANLTGIEACREIFPSVPQVAVFDTAFHQSMPPRAFRYAVPEAWYSRHGIRRYGFHGSSHRYVANRAADYLQRPLEELGLITLHLGNGASAAAIQHGRSIDTSMGFTPLEGLVMGTRCGDLDAAIPLHLEKVLGQSADELQEALNRDSGLKGFCGSNDLREVLAEEQSGDERARLALDVYCYRIRKYIGAYFVALDGLDALVFTGGVGENAPLIRSRVCQGLEKLGIAIDPAANDRTVEEISDIGRGGHSVRVLAVRTNEELQIARETLSVLIEPEKTVEHSKARSPNGGVESASTDF